MRCSKCGSDVGKGAGYCPNCGFKLDINIDILKIKVDDYKYKVKLCWILSLVWFAVFFSGLWSIFEFTTIRYELQEWTFYEILFSLLRKPVGILILSSIIYILTGISCAIYYTYKSDELIKQL